MPELPEVETVVRGLLNCGIVDLRVENILVSWPKLIEEGTSTLLIQATLKHIYRRGKFIVLAFDNHVSLLIHLRMTGRILFSTPSSPLLDYEKGRLIFETTTLCYTDVRTFGRWYIVKDVDKFLAHLGQDPFDTAFNVPLFLQQLASSKRAIKALLLDQSIVAGIGNIYADEALFSARLHPLRKASSLTKKEALILFQSIKEVLQQGITQGGSSLGKGKGNFQGIYGSFGSNQERFKVYQRTGKPCPICRTPIQRIIANQRSTHYCPSCQQHY